MSPVEELGAELEAAKRQLEEIRAEVARNEDKMRRSQRRELAKHDVSGRMTPGIVHALEMIDVQHQADQVGTVTLRTRQLLANA